MALSKESKILYDTIRAEYQITDACGLALLLSACESLDMARKAQKEIDKYGIIIEDKYSKVKANPACTVLKDSRTLMLNYIKSLNLDFSTIDNHLIPSGLLK